MITETSMVSTACSVGEKQRSCATGTAVGLSPTSLFSGVPFCSVGSAVETTIAPCLPELLCDSCLHISHGSSHSKATKSLLNKIQQVPSCRNVPNRTLTSTQEPSSDFWLFKASLRNGPVSLHNYMAMKLQF